MNSARGMLQFNFDADAFARRAPKPIAIPSETIMDLKRIQRDHNGMRNIPEREDLREIYHLFFNAVRTGRLHTEFDSLRRIQRLAWALTYSEDNLPRIVDTPELREALQPIEDRFSISALLGVFHALLEVWDTPNGGILRDFVGKYLAKYDARRGFVKNLITNLAWYCEENGAIQLAMNLLREHVNLSDVWSYLNLPDYTHGYRYFGAVAEAYVALNRRLDRSSVADIIVFVEVYKDDKKNRFLLSKTIEKLSVDAPEGLRSPLQSYVLREWKDPRLTSWDVRWRDVTDEARQIFTRWIMKEDLRFFFDIVSQACNDKKFSYRKAFWLAYFEHISDCYLVFREDVQDLLKNNPEALQYYHERLPAMLKGGNRDQHAFIIQMGDHTFVEFSTAGACYVYDDAGRPFDLGNSEYQMGELRIKRLAEHRVIHRNSETYHWQTDFEVWIEQELGITPLRSYQVEK